MTDDRAGVVDGVIRARRTTKVLAEDALPADEMRAVVDVLAEVGGWAPFHHEAAPEHTAGALRSIVPWRFHLVGAEGCRALRDALLARGVDNKEPRLLGAAAALVQVTWLPHAGRGEQADLFAGTEKNMEHIAAAGAAVQNLLLAATARGIRSYWGSGGFLRRPEAFRWMGIPQGEILLGSVYLFPAETGDAEVIPGKLREKRGAPSDWSRWVALDIPPAG